MWPRVTLLVRVRLHTFFPLGFHLGTGLELISHYVPRRSPRVPRGKLLNSFLRTTPGALNTSSPRRVSCQELASLEREGRGPRFQQRSVVPSK
jgi:hypothetical protein